MYINIRKTLCIMNEKERGREGVRERENFHHDERINGENKIKMDERKRQSLKNKLQGIRM